MTANQRILVIDDSPLVIESIRDGFEDDDIEVEGESDLSAIDPTRLDRFDLILIDVQMPEMFGDDLAMVIRQGRQVATPIVLLSSLPEPQLAARAIQAGVDGYISKRRGVDGVLDAIKERLASIKHRRTEGA